MRLTKAAPVLALSAVAATVGCSAGPPTPEPTARALVRALSAGNVALVTWAGATRAVVGRDLGTATAGLRGLHPRVRLVRLRGTGDRRTATLELRWDLDRTTHDWAYRATASLVRGDAGWRVRWSPAIVAPGLGRGDRLELSRFLADLPGPPIGAKTGTRSTATRSRRAPTGG